MPTTASATIVGGVETSVGIEAVRKLKSIDPPSYLSKSPEISEAARLASEYLFSSLKPYAPKSPFPHLLVNGFDAEQIWQQIDIQSQPLISALRRKVQNFEKNPKEIKSWFNVSENDKSVEEKRNELDVKEKEKEIEDFDDDDVTAFDDDDDDDDDDDEGEEEEDDDEEMEEEDEEEEQNLVDGDAEDGFEDQFLKINELEDYIEKDEARETKKGKKRSHDESADEEESEEEEEQDELEVMGLDDDEDGEGLNARYNDFFGGKGKNTQKRKSKSVHVSDHLDMDKELSDDDNNKKNEKLSAHEREQERIRSTIEEMEKSNLKPKSWIMQGEVTAAKRPKNSALEVDLDFEHNVRPAPVITDEVTASLEELIQKRIVEGRFDDVQKPPTLPSRAPREVKQLDENKSEKGLGDIYAEDYAKKTGLVSVAVSISDQQKKEAKLLFKELCLKLDALSHFHFTPKPVIEDMSIQVNVPALAMEEIAPSAVSDAAMLAPEEVFAGKGDIKEETELTQSDRKRRRAKKKRKFKANAAKMPTKPQPTPQSNIDGENEP